MKLPLRVIPFGVAMALLCPAAIFAGSARILKVENEGLLFTDNSAGVSGVDGYFSMPMGRQTLWIFGDVFLLDPTSPAKPWVGNVSNCGLLTPSGQGRRGLFTYQFLTDPKTGCARPLIANRPNEDNLTRIWPLAGYYDNAQPAAYLYYVIVHGKKGGGPLEFDVEGYGLARSDAGNPSALHFERLKSSDGSDLWGRPGDSPMFGSAIVSGVTGPDLYVLGYHDKKLKSPAVLARVNKRKIADQHSYEYFSGTADAPGWSAKPQEAADIAGLYDVPAVHSVAWNEYLGGYLAVHHVGITEKIRLCLAQQPWGPYETIGEITAPHKAFAKSFCYDGAEHPELAEENGRIIYITFVDSDRYWQQLYKVTLAR